MSRHWNPATDDPILKHLFQCGIGDPEIAERIGVSPLTVRRNRERLKLGVPPKKYQTGKPDEALPPLPEKNAPMLMAFRTFGTRLTEVNGTYRLGNTPIGFFDLMRETNRVLATEGKEQFGPPEWRVKP